MENIRIISRNKNLPEIISNILKSNFNVSAKDFYKDSINFQLTNPVLETADTLNINLIILDLTSLDIKKEIIYQAGPGFAFHPEFLKDSRNHDYKLIDELKTVQIPKLILMSMEQAGFLLENFIKYDDIIFSDQLDKELSIRINIILRRHRSASLGNILKVDDLILNLENYEVSVQGEIIEMTFKEYELLKYLIQNEGKVISRNILLSKIWGYDFYGGNRTVDVHMRHLRAKLPSPYDLMLKTVRQVGYIFSHKI
ncbi:MAG: response regulator transcription factor [Actinomycetota bacterium]|jgi:hypothetical protein|nr:response regulator transcription factor [Actinomycetota bacterium]